MRRVLLADDHRMFREGVRGLLESAGFEIAGEEEGGRRAVQAAARLKPDVAVLDIGMPELNGLDAARAILHEAPECAVVILTVHAEDTYVLEALRAGAKGYVLKDQAVADLVQAIQEACRGSIYLGPGISRVVVEAFLRKGAPPGDPLTLREREVLQLVAEGRTTKEIAESLGVSVKTCESHRVRIMKKLDIHNIAGLVRYAIRAGLIEP